MKMDIKDNSDEAKKWREYSRKPLDEKRKRYKCGDHYVMLKDVLPWSKYHQENLYYFKSRIEKGKEISKKHTVDIKLNDKVSLWTGDITALEIDAIVNAANTTLLGGGGVDGCIHRAAGDNLFKECRKLRGCQTGEAKITLGHRLPAKYVIHTAGPMGKNRIKLQDCYKNCLQLAKQHGVKTLAFCCISTGIYGYPNKDAAHVALETVRQWLETDNNNDSVERIIFCTFLPKDTEIYERLLLCYFPCEDPQKEEMSPVSSNNRGTVSPSESPNKRESSPLHEPPEGEAAPPCVPSNKREASSSGAAMNENPSVEGPAVKVMPPSDTVESQNEEKM
ncbi:ADP-ribose glycohydrolase MACROD1 isoform X2 [Nematostella vectensis]|uniref:ADP-ribose glycohydrolase MACROD1 isoform X2 n=1 Tax=Nematostella vectensis TaxID=45351 RepID=UPI0020777DE2|nr:ADP-ribose glycohydrolase MACROD1 isoform X2 [Nematostella vectensis]